MGVLVASWRTLMAASGPVTPSRSRAALTPSFRVARASPYFSEGHEARSSMVYLFSPRTVTTATGAGSRKMYLLPVGALSKLARTLDGSLSAPTVQGMMTSRLGLVVKLVIVPPVIAALGTTTFRLSA